MPTYQELTALASLDVPVTLVDPRTETSGIPDGRVVLYESANGLVLLAYTAANGWSTVSQYLPSLTVTGDLTVGGALTVTGNITAGGDLAVTGDSAFTGDVTITGDLVVAGGVTRPASWAFVSIQDTDTAATVISDTTNYFDVNATTFTFNADSADFTHSAGVLTYTGTRTKKFSLVATMTVTSAAANKDIEFRFELDGTPDETAGVSRKLATANEEGALALQGLFEVAQGQTINLAVRNKTTASDVTVVHLQIMVSEFPNAVA